MSFPPTASFLVQDVDLAFWRRYEEIKSDQKLFLNDGEWELVSVLSERRILQTQTGSIAQIRFHVSTWNIVTWLLYPLLFLSLPLMASFNDVMSCSHLLSHVLLFSSLVHKGFLPIPGPSALLLPGFCVVV